MKRNKNRRVSSAAGFQFSNMIVYYTIIVLMAFVFLFHSQPALAKTKDASFHQEAELFNCTGHAGIVGYALPKHIKAVHGILRIVYINQEGQESLQAEMEVWWDRHGRYYTEMLEGSRKGLAIANNGSVKWIMVPDEKMSVWYPSFPDDQWFALQLGKEMCLLNDPPKTLLIGQERVSGRDAYVVKVMPEGGLPYQLWLDQATGLHIQEETILQNGLQYRFTYSDIEMHDYIPSEKMNYSIPEGYTQTAIENEQAAGSLDEAAAMAGFEPDLPDKILRGYDKCSISVIINTGTVKQTYANTKKNQIIVMTQSIADNDFSPDPTSVIGKIGSQIAEVRYPVQSFNGVLTGSALYGSLTNLWSIRWQRDGLEYAVTGNTPEKEMIRFLKSLSPKNKVQIPYNAAFRPKTKAAWDLIQEKNQQISTDAGHTPYRLDPVFTALVFANRVNIPDAIHKADKEQSEDTQKLFNFKPQIISNQQLEYGELKIVMNNGKKAIVEITNHKALLKKVYLKKLIRQDYTGIWTVVGYDRR